jgi:uncharacterized protein YprB with RNaseH-like and TPR domain
LSDLRERLERLADPARLDGPARLGRPARHPGESRDPGSLPPSLAERIARLRTRSAEINARRPTDAELAQQLCGRVVAAGLVEVVRSFPLPFAHGATRIASARALAAGVRLSLDDGDAIDAEALLFLDTETSGLAGGTGTVAFVLGLATVRDDVLAVRQLLMTGFGGERALLEALGRALSAHECLVTFNGKSFDVPLLRARTRLAGLEWPAAEPRHLDLLHVTRRRLREGWADCRLRTAEEQALGFERTDDFPGSEVPAAWQRWLQRGDAVPLPRILDHNREDLLSLAGLLAVLAAPTRREAPLLHADRGTQPVAA